MTAWRLSQVGSETPKRAFIQSYIPLYLLIYRLYKEYLLNENNDKKTKWKWVLLVKVRTRLGRSQKNNTHTKNNNNNNN